MEFVFWFVTLGNLYVAQLLLCVLLHFIYETDAPTSCTQFIRLTFLPYVVYCLALKKELQ